MTSSASGRGVTPGKRVQQLFVGGESHLEWVKIHQRSSTGRQNDEEKAEGKQGMMAAHVIECKGTILMCSPTSVASFLWPCCK
jgi:hypothetical protein